MKSTDAAPARPVKCTCDANSLDSMRPELHRSTCPLLAAAPAPAREAGREIIQELVLNYGYNGIAATWDKDPDVLAVNAIVERYVQSREELCD